MKVTGYYTKDNNFIYVYCDDNTTIYHLSLNSKRYGVLTVGKATANGWKVTQDYFNEQKSKYTDYGTFEI